MKKILSLFLLMPCALSAMEKPEHKAPDVSLDMTFTLIDKANNIVDTTHHSYLAYYDGSFESNTADNAPKTHSQTDQDRSLSLVTTLLDLAVHKKVQFDDDEDITLPTLKTAWIQYTICRRERPSSASRLPPAWNWDIAQNATFKCDLLHAQEKQGYNMPLLLMGLTLNVKAKMYQCFQQQ